MSRALFGSPVRELKRGGTRITVYVVPVYEQQLVACDVTGDPALAGRWLPWDVLVLAESPHGAASLVVDRWCDASMLDLRLVDALTLSHPDDTWEVALIFRAELGGPPIARAGLAPVLLPGGALEGVAPFAADDLRRWMGAPSPTGGTASAHTPPAIF